MNVFTYWILLKSDQSCICVLVVSIWPLSKILLLKFGTGTVQTVVFFVFVLLFDRIQYRPWYFQERYCLRLYGLFVRIPKKHYGTKICSFTEIFCCLLLYSSRSFLWQVFFDNSIFVFLISQYIDWVITHLA